jgi:class 3 adenylate cyclase
VIAESEDIFGDGVNVAARLEALAEPGGIRVSRVARDQVRDRLDQRSSKAVSHSTGDQRFDSRLLQEETVKRTSNYVDLTRRAGTLLLLARSDSRPGGQGRQSGRQRPIGEVDRANQNRLAPSRQMRPVYP